MEEPAADEASVVAVRPRPGESDHVDDISQEEFVRFGVAEDISGCAKLGFSVGHFYNDLCASMWFTYLMIFLEKILLFKSGLAGFLMLIGQVTDAVCTPLIGIASDSAILPEFVNRIGRRISWHAIGTICVTISFPFIFNQCLLCTDSTGEVWRVLWFIPPIMIFQFGWASVQISHLALIPELSHVDSSRRTMNSLRYGFTVLANVSVFVVLMYLLRGCPDKEKGLNPEDIAHFRLAGFLVVGAGLLSCIPFYCTTREPPQARSYSRLNSYTSQASQLSRMHWTSWFGHLQFYQIALLYMLARLYMNISQVYMPFYITITQNLEKTLVAVVPMISFLSSFIISTLFSIPFLNRMINKKLLYVTGLITGLANCTWMYFPLHGWWIYGVAVVLGVAQSILLVTSLDITADLINRNTESGAFVYGAMSFMDKLANGVAYQLIELINPGCDSSSPAEICPSFYRSIMVYIPAVCLLLSLVVLISLLPSDIGLRRRRRIQPDDVVAILQEESENQEALEQNANLQNTN